MEIYLDNSATTAVCPEAVAAATEALTDVYGNPSSQHSVGIRAKQLLEKARGQVAASLSVQPKEIRFAPSGTVANNTAVTSAVWMRRRWGTRIVTSSVEHPSVAKVMDELENKGFQVVRLKPTLDGAVDPEDIMEAVTPDTILVSLMYVNNETGAINPVEYARRAIRASGSHALVHVDAIQAYGKMIVRPRRIGADFLTVSGHKIHAPKGAAALYSKLDLAPRAFIVGGGQEGGVFSGTENMPAIAGFGAAAEALPDPVVAQREMRTLRRRLIKNLSPIPSIIINSPKGGLPNIVNMSILGMPSQTLVNFFSERGICVSAGSACKKGHRSQVLTELGISPLRIDSAIRVSMSRYTTEEEVDKFCEAATEAVNYLRSLK